MKISEKQQELHVKRRVRDEIITKISARAHKHKDIAARSKDAQKANQNIEQMKKQHE